MPIHVRSRILSALLLGLALMHCASDQTVDAVMPRPVEVDCNEPIAFPSGSFRGVRDRSSCALKGIPFAQAPVGDLRFQFPKPQAKHTGIRPAFAFGKDCIQNQTFAEPGVAEDCLYLNVWAPGETADGKFSRNLPVMVFFYGGGFVSGGGSWSFYNGERFTTHGVILVTVNYRLGPFGYLAPSAVTGTDGSPLRGNLGLRDQIAALQWVQANISAIGGDKKRVTIFGESAGAWSVCDLMAAEGTDGLFHRAIMQSGECYVGSRALTAAKADAWITAAGCPVTGATAMPCLRAIEAEDLPDTHPYSMGGGIYPNVDGNLLTDQPLVRLRAGAASGIALITGYNSEETDALRLFPEHNNIVTGSFADFWSQASHALSVAELERLREVYADASYANPMALATAMLDDIIFACPAFDAVGAQVSRGAPAWHYRFSVGAGESALEPYTGSFHGLEIPYVFGNTGGLVFIYSQTDAWKRMYDFTQRIQRYWTRFAATGDPNGGNDPHWPGFGVKHSRMELTVDTAVSQGTSDARCGFWGGVVPFGLGERFEFIDRLVGFNPIGG